MKVYVDGSLTCIAVVSDACQLIEDVSVRTHNEAEYLAIIRALELFPGEEIEICSDSQLAVRQINGEYRTVEPRLQILLFEVRRALLGREAKFTWVPREENLAGKLLEVQPRSYVVRGGGGDGKEG